MPRHPDTGTVAHGLSANVYTALAKLAADQAPEVFSLNVGDTYLAPPRGMAEGAHLDATTGGYAYAPVQGEPVLLDALCADHARRERPVAREQLQVTIGATSGLDLVCRLLLRPGDEVLVLAPFWPLIRGIVSAAGGRAVEVPFFSEVGRAGFDIEKTLEAAITPRTVALYVNSPHNPTGAVLDADAIAELAAVVRRHELWLLSDEAYEALWHSQPAPAVWMHPALRERAFVAHTLSKRFGIAGARIGYVHGPLGAMRALQDLQTYSTYCAARPMQRAAARLLTSQEGEDWTAEARALYRRAAAQTAEALELRAPTSGTFVAFDTVPWLRDGETPEALLARVARRGVVLTPGAAIGAAYASWARLCFTAVPPERLSRALSILRDELSR